MHKVKEIVGLIPAAGFANRIADEISCSKEVYPIDLANGKTRAAASFLLDSYKAVNIHKACFIIRQGKWDIPQYFLDGTKAGVDISYIVTESTKGVPFTLDKAYSFVKESIVLVGFPDIIFTPVDAFTLLLEKQKKTQADLVLGLFETDKPEKADMVEFDARDNIKDIIIKPDQTTLLYTWIIAAWTPAFTRFMHSFLFDRNRGLSIGHELHIGDVVRAAIHSGMHTSHVTFTSGSFLDIGTSDDLERVRSQDWIRRHCQFN